ncbi:transketolase family protein [Sinanaerobacter chloroacetimidivorans]|jgi:transketolase|uniref:Transketolase n=1 Tax=Sinanaerobacter chloroacetimidivorans TaxID=2818044 RepID=A0A8J7W003_9FIRM|nr:transketolase C-terminal domain-containing protein [Sinanaerobacter chloroacetimidivorans]MBR0598259.1 transketolase [Sinanaerobacter chloroacetimidivorans]
MKIEVNTHEKSMIRWASEHPEAVVLSADLGSSCEVKEFLKTYPDRYFSLGIAEQNMVSWAAGLAREGFRPYLHTFGVFLYRRVLDQLEMSVAYPNLPVTFVGFLPGIMTPGGVSHQAINDVAVLRNIPNMTIFDVGDATDIESVLEVTHQVNGPVFIRMLRKDVPRLFPANEPLVFNRGRVLSEGTDIAIFSSSICTEEAMRATKVLEEKGLSIQHVHISTLKPFTDPTVVETLKKVKYGAVTIENHVTIGGLGTAVADVIAEEGIGTKLVKVGIQDTYTHGASKMYLMKKYGLDAMTLIKAIEKLTGKSYGIQEEDLETVRFEDYTAV